MILDIQRGCRILSPSDGVYTEIYRHWDEQTIVCMFIHVTKDTMRNLMFAMFLSREW